MGNVCTKINKKDYDDNQYTMIQNKVYLNDDKYWTTLV